MAPNGNLKRQLRLFEIRKVCFVLTVGGVVRLNHKRSKCSYYIHYENLKTDKYELQVIHMIHLFGIPKLLHCI